MSSDVVAPVVKPATRPVTVTAHKVDDAQDIATARRMRADGHTSRDIANDIGVSRASCIDTSPRTPLPDRDRVWLKHLA
jgi:hypothetical protein